MDTITFDKLLLKTAFCCMAADGKIDSREISIIKSLCEKSPFFTNFNFQEEINLLVNEINNGGKAFIRNYLDLLKEEKLTEEEALTLIDFAIKTIKADEQIEYSEIKFFKNIRHRLNVSDDKILARFPDIEQYLEDDIITDDYIDKITSQFFEISELPQFDLISITDSSQDKQE
jgi:hypothetical protein